jgi:hypothetical protein
MTISIKTVLVAAAPLLLVGAVALSTPAGAVEWSQAQKTCAANPNCSPGPTQVDGSHYLLIKQSDGTTSAVDCPAKGPCMIMAKGSPRGGKPVAGPSGNGSGVLAASPGSAAKPEILTNRMGGSADDKKGGPLQAAGARAEGSRKH